MLDVVERGHLDAVLLVVHHIRQLGLLSGFLLFKLFNLLHRSETRINLRLGQFTPDEWLVEVISKLILLLDLLCDAFDLFLVRLTALLQKLLLRAVHRLHPRYWMFWKRRSLWFFLGK